MKQMSVNFVASLDVRREMRQSCFGGTSELLTSQDGELVNADATQGKPRLTMSCKLSLASESRLLLTPQMPARALVELLQESRSFFFG